MHNGSDATAKHMRRMPAPRLKGQFVAPAGKPGVALYRVGYVRIGQVADEVRARLGGLVCCIYVKSPVAGTLGRAVIGRLLLIHCVRASL
jgi:hypothetical protein